MGKKGMEKLPFLQAIYLQCIPAPLKEIKEPVKDKDY